MAPLLSRASPNRGKHNYRPCLRWNIAFFLQIWGKNTSFWSLYFFPLFYIKMPSLPRLSIVWQWLQLQKLLFLHNTQMWGGPQESASCSVRKEDTMCRNYVGIFLQINWYFHAYFYATQTKSSLNQTWEITKWQKEIHFYSTLISSQDAVLKEYKSFRR